MIPLLTDLFELSSKQNVIELKASKKKDGFRFEFGIKIKISMHPADYIDRFDDIANDHKIQEAVQNGFELEEEPHIHIWEARYEKLEKNDDAPNEFEKSKLVSG